MNNTFRKTLLAFAVTTVCAFSANTASASTFNLFTVHPLGMHENFTADRIVGQYDEVISFTENPSSTAANGTGTFTSSIAFKAFSFTDSTPDSPQLDAARTGLGLDYRIYALYNASGTFTRTGTAATFDVIPNSGSIHMFLDQGKDTEIKKVGTTFSATGITSDDIELAGGLTLAGHGDLTGTTAFCSPTGGIYCGFASSTTQFNLTTAGKTFFVVPNPFYNSSFQSGQLDNFDPTGIRTLTGSLDVVFLSAAEVPEPASIALLGLGLLGFAASRRKSAKSKNA